jgi:hypothetical protein
MMSEWPGPTDVCERDLLSITTICFLNESPGILGCYPGKHCRQYWIITLERMLAGSLASIIEWTGWVASRKAQLVHDQVNRTKCPISRVVKPQL